MADLSTVERLDWRTLMSWEGDADIPRVLDAYFEPFAQPKVEEAEDGKGKDVDQHCLNCGKAQVGLSSLLLGGGFQWGMAHGEGSCSSCGWPARAIHFLKSEAGEDIGTLNLVLQYHPDFVTMPEAAKAGEVRDGR